MKKKLNYWLFMVNISLITMSVNAANFQMSDPIVTYGSNAQGTLNLPPDAELRNSTTNIIEVDFVGEWSPMEKEAFNAAVKLWEKKLWDVKGIKIQASFGTVSNGALAQTSVGSLNGDEMNILPGTDGDAAYPAALARRIDTQVAESEDIDAAIVFNPNKELWYFGTDGNVPSSKYDFVTAALRELTKSLGVYTMVTKNARNNTITSKESANTLFTIYDKQIMNSSYIYLRDLVFNSPAVADFVQRKNTYANRDVFFSSYYTSGNLKLYAPTTFENNVSLMYFDESAYANPESALMAPKQRKGEAIHRIGENVVSVLEGIGWNIRGQAVGMYTDPVVRISANIPEYSLVPLNTSLTFSTSCTDGIIMSNNWYFQALKQDGTFQTITTKQNGNFTLSLNLTTIPAGNWARDEDGMIKGRILTTGVVLDTREYPSVYRDFTVDFDVLIPAKPAKPEVQLSIVDRMADWESDVMIEFSSLQKVTNYIVKENQQGYLGFHIHIIPSNQNTYFLEGVWMDVGHIIRVVAENQYGVSEETVLTIGGDPDYYTSGVTPLSLNVSERDLVTTSPSGSGVVELRLEGGCPTTDAQIKQVEIVNLINPVFVKRGENYGSSASFDMQQLPDGFYAVKVTDEQGKTYTSKFHKH